MDLVIVFLLAALVLPFVLLTAGTPRVILGLLFLLIIPGYVFAAGMIPQKKSLGSVQRLAISLGLSIAVVSLIGFALSYTPWGITLSSVVITVAVFIVMSTAFALYRRRQVPEDDRFGIRLRMGLPPWKEASRLDRVLSIVVVLSALAAIGTFAYALTTPKEGERFTEFYALGSQGLIEGRHLEASHGQEVRVTLGIVNHEHQDTSYHLEVRLNGEKVQEAGPINLAHTGTWKGTATLVAARVGEDQKVEFLMYRDGGGEPYRELHLWLDVEEAE